MFNNMGIDRIALDITSCGQQMILIQNARRKPSLKKVTSYAFLKIFHAGVASMSFSDCPGKRIFFGRNGYEMDMVGHEAPGEKDDAETLRLLSHKTQVLDAVIITGEDIHGADTPLGDVMRITGDNESCEAGHGYK